MSDVARRLEAAKGHVAVEWTDERSRAAERGLGVRRARRTKIRALGGLAVLTTVVVSALLFLRPGRALFSNPKARTTSAGAPLATAPTTTSFVDPSIELADGSVIHPSAGAVIVPRSVTSASVLVDVVRGVAAFDVVHDPARTFVVVAGPVTVEDIGTTFSVERTSAGAHVAVTRGRVRVAWGSEKRILGDGESGDFPPEALAPEASASAAVEAPPAPPVAKPSWRAYAKEGAYDKAYEALGADGAASARDEPEELLLAADVARLSGHPEQAIAPLRRVVESHRGDARAALAAFTLGRVLLDQLGRPAEAAVAFADVRALGGGGLGEEALAREVEALSRAGETEKAHALAEEYVSQFPKGRRMGSVRKFGALD